MKKNTKARRLATATLITLCSALFIEGALAQTTKVKTPDLKLGAEIFSGTCSVCHGENGDAKSWAQNSLYPPPRNFKSEEAEELTRLAMMTTLRKGNADTAMVSFSTQLDDHQMQSVISYIRTEFMGKDDTVWMKLGVPEIEAPFLSGLHGDYAAGKTFFNNNCAECHGKGGKGDGRRAYFINPKPADFTSEKMRARLNRPALFSDISMGVARKEMPAWSKVLNDQQIANVAEYVFNTFVLPDDELINASSAAPEKN